MTNDEFTQGLNTFVNAEAPSLCCRLSENLGPFEQEGVSAGPLGAAPMVMGFRRCTVCQSRHFLARAIPGEVKIAGTDTK